MVRIFAISDIHLEFGPVSTDMWPPADILVLAGDVGTDPIAIKTFITTLKPKYRDIIFIAGNHEFYKCNYNYKNVIEDLQQVALDTDTHFLHNNIQLVQGIEFIGTTLWSLIENEAVDCIADFETVFKHRTDYIEAFIYDFRFLRNALATPSEHPRVVVTHHLPTSDLIHPRFEGNTINSAFYTDILDQVRLEGVTYWFCGHTHEYMKCSRGDTELVVNPLGYPKERRKTSVSYEVYEI